MDKLKIVIGEGRSYANRGGSQTTFLFKGTSLEALDKTLEQLKEEIYLEKRQELLESVK